MNEHIQSLPVQREYSDKFKEEAAIRVLFSGQDPSEVAWTFPTYTQSNTG